MKFLPIISFLALALSFGGAVQANQWISAGGKECPEVCGEYDLKPVPLEGIAGMTESFVCAAPWVKNKSDTGRRAGYYEFNNGLGKCNIFVGGDKAGNREKLYSCLCLNAKLPPP